MYIYTHAGPTLETIKGGGDVGIHFLTNPEPVYFTVGLGIFDLAKN